MAVREWLGQGLPPRWWSFQVMLRWEVCPSGLSSSAVFICGEPTDPSSPFWIVSGGEGFEGRVELAAGGEPARVDRPVGGEGFFCDSSTRSCFSPMSAGSPIRRDLGTCLVGMGTIEGLVVTEEVSLKGEEMEFELRPDLDSSPRHRVELLPADEEQSMPATNVQEGAVSIGSPDSMLAANLMVPCSIDGGSAIDDRLKLQVKVGLDGEGEPVTSPVTDGLRVNGLGFTAAIGADLVVTGAMDVGEFQLVAIVRASSLAVSALGVQVMDDGGGQRPRLVEPDGGLTSTCSSDVIVIDVQQLASVSMAVSLLDGEQSMEEGAGGAAKQLPSVTVSSSRFPLSVSDGDSVGVGPVREEVRVLPTIREALWPQPTDGLG
ncbi:hypothetical protein Dimus_033543 [Dionaea muscipula]